MNKYLGSWSVIACDQQVTALKTSDITCIILIFMIIKAFSYHLLKNIVLLPSYLVFNFC